MFTNNNISNGAHSYQNKIWELFHKKFPNLISSIYTYILIMIYCQQEIHTALLSK